MYRNLKRSGSIYQYQSRFKKRCQTQEEPRRAKVKLEKGGGSQYGKPTYVSCKNRHYKECLKGIGSYFCCGK